MKKKKEITYYAEYGRDGDWIDNSKRVFKLEEADILVLQGGCDWYPGYYNEKPNSSGGWYNKNRDEVEHVLYKKAIELGIFIVGLCRGAQGICLFQEGGKLVQDMHHPGGHTVHTEEGNIFTNSMHHQLMYPWNIKKEEYKILGWTLGLSNSYTGEDDKELDFPEEAYIDGSIIEPEIIWFPKVKGLAIQFHPELMSTSSSASIYLNDKIKELFVKQKELVN